MFRFLHITVAAIALVLLVPLSSYASITLGSLGLGQNELEDDDFEMLVNQAGGDSLGTILAPGTSTLVDAGDFLTGIFRIGAIRVPPGGPQVATATDTEATFTARFLLKVASVTPVGGGPLNGILDTTFAFSAPTNAEWLAVFAGTGLPAPLSTLGLPGGSTMAIMHEDPDNIDQSLPIAAAFATADGPMAWEFGFKGLGGELFTTSTDTADLATAFSIITGAFTANLNVTAYGIGPLLTPQAVFGGFADALLRNGSVGSQVPGSSFPVSSDVDILITTNVPEPGSIFVFGLLIASCAALVGVKRYRGRIVT